MTQNKIDKNVELEPKAHGQRSEEATTFEPVIVKMDRPLKPQGVHAGMTAIKVKVGGSF